jgi:hypothetical protein
MPQWRFDTDQSQGLYHDGCGETNAWPGGWFVGNEIRKETSSGTEVAKNASCPASASHYPGNCSRWQEAHSAPGADLT